jgi:hypothetical protein
MEDNIFIADCCLKQQIKNFSDLLGRKRLTDREALLLCAYQIAMNIMIDIAIIRFKLTYLGLFWLLENIFSNKLILLGALFLNSLIIIQVVECIKEFIHTLRCKCEYRYYFYRRCYFYHNED